MRMMNDELGDVAVQGNVERITKIDKDRYPPRDGVVAGEGVPIMNVSLTPQLEKLVRKKVASGRYNSASEVVREALRLLEEHRLREMRLEELRKEIAVGLEQLERGEHTEHDEQSLRALCEQVKTEGRRRLAKQRKGG